MEGRLHTWHVIIGNFNLRGPVIHSASAVIQQHAGGGLQRQGSGEDQVLHVSTGVTHTR